ncbi:MAG TPA: hypothetical protein VE029_00600 [Rhizobacter sp.]|nr:hypothetical protein [Rhizobacter sp.]
MTHPQPAPHDHDESRFGDHLAADADEFLDDARPASARLAPQEKWRPAPAAISCRVAHDF